MAHSRSPPFDPTRLWETGPSKYIASPFLLSTSPLSLAPSSFILPFIKTKVISLTSSFHFISSQISSFRQYQDEHLLAAQWRVEASYCYITAGGPTSLSTDGSHLAQHRVGAHKLRRGRKISVSSLTYDIIQDPSSRLHYKQFKGSHRLQTQEPSPSIILRSPIGLLHPISGDSIVEHTRPTPVPELRLYWDLASGFASGARQQGVRFRDNLPSSFGPWRVGRQTPSELRGGPSPQYITG
ncbi:hypothetical protein BDZ45DRAFT_741425 [Acephala macrosclerotiorum]|nr:hypothetical protein BDZ45DRAFT_741425 [Acephala macrosclerotiorum]